MLPQILHWKVGLPRTSRILLWSSLCLQPVLSGFSCWKTDISESISTLRLLLNKFETKPAALFTESRPTTGVKPNQDRRPSARSLTTCRWSPTCHCRSHTIPGANRVSVWIDSDPGTPSVSTVALSPLVKAWLLPNASRELHTRAASAGTFVLKERSRSSIRGSGSA
jgi:hypothetical protein